MCNINSHTHIYIHIYAKFILTMFSNTNLTLYFALQTPWRTRLPSREGANICSPSRILLASWRCIPELLLSCNQQIALYTSRMRKHPDNVPDRPRVDTFTSDRNLIEVGARVDATWSTTNIPRSLEGGKYLDGKGSILILSKMHVKTAIRSRFACPGPEYPDTSQSWRISKFGGTKLFNFNIFVVAYQETRTVGIWTAILVTKWPFYSQKYGTPTVNAFWKFVFYSSFYLKNRYQ